MSKSPCKQRTSPLALRKLDTVEDEDERHELVMLEKADAHARDLIISGPFLHQEQSYVRIVDAVGALTATTRCDCLKTATREHGAYYVGVAVGLGLARAVDGGVYPPPQRAVGETPGRVPAARDPLLTIRKKLTLAMAATIGANEDEEFLGGPQASVLVAVSDVITDALEELYWIECLPPGVLEQPTPTDDQADDMEKPAEDE